MMFSATIEGELRNTCKRFMHNVIIFLPFISILVCDEISLLFPQYSLFGESVIPTSEKPHSLPFPSVSPASLLENAVLPIIHSAKIDLYLSLSLWRF
jgi:hypothetical protein